MMSCSFDRKVVCMQFMNYLGATCILIKVYLGRHRLIKLLFVDDVCPAVVGGNLPRAAGRTSADYDNMWFLL